MGSFPNPHFRCAPTADHQGQHTWRVRLPRRVREPVTPVIHARTHNHRLSRSRALHAEVVEVSGDQEVGQVESATSPVRLPPEPLAQFGLRTREVAVCESDDRPGRLVRDRLFPVGGPYELHMRELGAVLQDLLDILGDHQPEVVPRETGLVLRPHAGPDLAVVAGH